MGVSDALDGGKGDGGLTSAERKRSSPGCGANRKLKEEREILPKAAGTRSPPEHDPSKRSSGS